MRWLRSSLLCALACVVLARAVPAAEEATIRVTNWSAGLVLGYRWGSGVLEYRGEEHPFRVRGFSALDLGVSRQALTGKVSNLDSLAEFDGVYTMFSAGGPWGENILEKSGVVVHLDSDIAGIEAKLGFDWVSFTLE